MNFYLYGDTMETRKSDIYEILRFFLKIYIYIYIILINDLKIEK